MNNYDEWLFSNLVQGGLPEKITKEQEMYLEDVLANRKDWFAIQVANAERVKISRNNPYKEIITAFNSNDYEKLDEIISNGFDVNSEVDWKMSKKTMLGNATISNDTEMIDFLIKKGADIKQDAFAFSAAAYQGNIDLLEKYLDLGADINGTAEHNALVNACDNNQLKAVKFLIEHGADIHKPVSYYDERLETSKPLEFATSNNNLEMIDYLVEHGAKITQDILFSSAMSDGTAFNHYVGKHNVEITEQTEQNIRAFDLTNAIETIDKMKLRNKLENKLQEKETQSFSMDKPKPSLSKKMKSQGMKL